MRHTLKIYAIPLWPLVKNIFVISLIVSTLAMVIMGFFWMGLMREFATQFSNPQMGFQLETLRNMSSIFVFIFAILNGVVGSFFLTLFAGLGALIYNWMNRRYGGFEFEVSLPEMAVSSDSASTDNPRDTGAEERPDNLNN